MTNLTKSAGWPEVRQLEETDPVLGGAPNPETGEGLDNVPHLQLLQRTEKLKLKFEGLGIWDDANIEDVTDLDAIEGTKFFRFDVNAQSAPPSNNSYVAVGHQIESSEKTAQMVHIWQDTAIYVRIKNVNGWTDWEAVVTSRRSVYTAGLASGGGSLAADRTINVPAASQSEAEGGTVNNRAMTPQRTAQAIDKRVGDMSLTPQSRSISTAGLASGGGNLSSNRTIDVPIASQTEAEAATSNSRAMTPLRVKQAFNRFFADVKGVVQGRKINAAGLASGGGDLAADRTITVEAASQSDAETGTINTKAMTPVRVKQAIEKFMKPQLLSLSTNDGYIRLPQFLGGLMIAWGNVGGVSSGTDVYFGTPFPNYIFTVIVTDQANDLSTIRSHVVSVFQTTLQSFKCLVVRTDGGGAEDLTTNISYIAIGR